MMVGRHASDLQKKDGHRWTAKKSEKLEIIAIYTFYIAYILY